MRVAIIGAGPNGLTAASLLSTKGHEVVLLDKGDEVGGLAAGLPVGDSQTRHGGIFHDTHLIQARVLKDLRLQLTRRTPPPVHTPDGTPLVRPKAWQAFIAGLKPLVDAVVASPPPDPGVDAPTWPWMRRALDLRRMGDKPMMELLRIGPQSIDDTLREFFDDPRQRALMMPPALLGAWMGPLSPTGTAQLLLHEALRGSEVVGGPAAVVQALKASLGRRVTVRNRAEVTRIEVLGGRARGVTLASGERIDADRVISCIGPRRTLRDLIDPMALPPILDRDLPTIRTRGIHAKVHLVTDAPLFAHERVRIGADPLDLERAFDDAKHRRMVRAPTLDIRQVGTVTSIVVFGAAHDLDEGWNAHTRKTLGTAVLRTLAEHVGNVRSRVTHMEVLTPADLEHRYGLDGGHLLHGEIALDQLWFMRPLPRVARGAAGIGGLVLGSHGMHPGLAMTLVPGWLAAKAVMA